MYKLIFLGVIMDIYVLYTGKCLPPFYFLPLHSHCQLVNIRLCQLKKKLIIVFIRKSIRVFFMRKKLYLIRNAKIKWDKNKPVYNNEKRKKFLRMMANMWLFFFQLDIMEPKIPEDIYKSHLEQTSKSGVFFSMKLPIFWMSF